MDGEAAAIHLLNSHDRGFIFKYSGSCRTVRYTQRSNVPSPQYDDLRGEQKGE